MSFVLQPWQLLFARKVKILSRPTSVDYAWSYRGFGYREFGRPAALH